MGIKTLNKKFHKPIYAIYGFVRFADEIVENIRQAGMVPGIEHVDVDTVFDPPFTMESVPEETRMMMGW